MARFYGKVGYGESVEKSDGVWDDVITEFNYYGDVVQNSRRLSEGESVNSNILVSNSISIVADDHAMKHFHAIRYVEWAGALWTVTNVTVQRPRLLLRLGEPYNGPRPTP
jgi:hypothetical protein